MSQIGCPKSESVQFRNGCVTWFKDTCPTDLWSEKLKYVAYAVETCPTTGRKHLQMWASMHRPQRFSMWRKLFEGAHIEVMRGTFEQNDKYCSKEGTLVELGEKPMKDGHRRDLTTFCERLKEGERLNSVVEDLPQVYVQFHSGLRSLSYLVTKPYEHESVRGFWIWGSPGTGKSYYARNRFDDIYIKGQNKWFDGYNGERTILLDDYDCGKALGHYLKIWMDKYSCKGETKGGYVNLQHHYFVVTSNYSIEQMFESDESLIAAVKRRCEVIHSNPGRYLWNPETNSAELESI